MRGAKKREFVTGDPPSCTALGKPARLWKVTRGEKLGLWGFYQEVVVLKKKKKTNKNRWETLRGGAFLVDASCGGESKPQVPVIDLGGGGL